MLRMKPVKDGKRAEAYYPVTDGGYYAGADGLRTEWGGKGATKLKLEGTPDFEQFKRLVHGLEPHTGLQLTAKLVEHRIAAWDLTASVPKGVTVALERGDDRIHGILWAANRRAMADVEAFATTRVRKGGRQEDRLTGNLVFYATEHPDTRPVEDDAYPQDHPWRVMPDMDRHVHNVVFNVTFDEEEQAWKAVKFRPIMDLRKFFDRRFDAYLASMLADAGYEIETRWKRDEKGATKYFTWDIKGIPETVTLQNSRRSAEVDATEAAILAEMEAEHGSAPSQLSAVVKDQLGATSRLHKRDDLTLPACREFWDSRIGEDDGGAIQATIDRARAGENPPLEQTAEAAVAFALHHHGESRSVFGFEELAVTAMERSLGAASPEAIDAEIHRQAIVIERDGKRWVTTGALQAEEDFIVSQAHPLINVPPVGVPEGLEQGRLNEEQWQAVTGLLTSPCRVCLLEGPAGAGKSSLLQKFDEGMRMQGETVHYLATTAKAAEVLEADGFTANTLARFLVDANMQEAARGQRIVVDETSMLGHADAVRLFQLTKALDLKLICIGDPIQHSPVTRGAFHHLLKNHAGVQPFTLSRIMRQQDAEYLAAAERLSRGETLAGLDLLAAKGWVKEVEDDAERYSQIAAEYLAATNAGESVLVVSPSHAEGAKIQEAIRATLRAAGKLGAEEREFTRLVGVDASEAERGQETTYQPGDIIEFFQNAVGHRKGTRLTLGSPKQAPLQDAGKFRLFKPVSVRLSVGDRIRITSNVKTLVGNHTLKNGATRTVAGFDRQGNIKLDNGWIIGKDAGHFRLAWCETSMGSQGTTVQKVILGMGSESLPAMSQEQLYVSATRGRRGISVYTDDADALREAVCRSSQKMAALDLRPKPEAKPPTVKPTLVQRVRRWMEHRRRLGFFHRQRAASEAQARPVLRPLYPTLKAWRQEEAGRHTSHAEQVRIKQTEREGGYGR